MSINTLRASARRIFHPRTSAWEDHVDTVPGIIQPRPARCACGSPATRVYERTRQAEPVPMCRDCAPIGIVGVVR